MEPGWEVKERKAGRLTQGWSGKRGKSMKRGGAGADRQKEENWGRRSEKEKETQGKMLYPNLLIKT